MKFRILFLVQFVAALAHGQSFPFLKTRVDSLISAGDLTAAQPLADRLVQVAIDSFGLLDTNTINSLETAGLIRGKENDFGGAAVFYDSSLSICKRLYDPCHPIYQRALRSAATVRIIDSRYAAAEALMLEAKAVFEKKDFCGDRNAYYKILKRLADVYLKQSRFTEAESLYQIFYTDFLPATRKDSLEYARALSNYALMESKLGRYANAENLLLTAKNIQTEYLTPSDDELGNTQESLAVLYMEINDWERAEMLLNHRLNLRKNMTGQMRPRDAFLYLNLAEVYRNKKLYDQALLLYRQALTVVRDRRGKENEQYITLVRNLAGCLSEMKDYTLIDSLLEEGEQLSQKVSGTYSLARGNFLKDRMVLFGHTGQMTLMQDYYRQCLVVFDSILQPEHPAYIDLLFNRLHFYRVQGNFEAAAALYEKVLPALYNNLENSFAAFPDRQRGALLLDANGYFYQFSQLAAEAYLQLPELAGRLYDFCMLSKGWLFHTSQKIKTAVETSSDSSLQADYAKWQTIRNKLAGIYSNPKPATGLRPAYVDSLSILEEQLEQRLTKGSARFAAGFGKRVYSWTDIRDALKPGEAAVEILRYRRTDSGGADPIGYVALVVTAETRNHPVLVVFPEGTKMESTWFDAYLSGVTDTLLEPPSFSYTRYWAPLEPWLSQVKTVYFSPDGVFHKIALPTLRKPNSTYLLDQTDIRVVTRTDQLLRTDSPAPDPAPETCALFGNPRFDYYSVGKPGKKQPESNLFPPALRNINACLGDWRLDSLPYTEKEVQEVGKRLAAHGLRPSVFVQNDASEEQLKALVNPRVVHLASHGLFLAPERDHNGRPASSKQSYFDQFTRSLLFLAGAQTTLERASALPGKEDGILTALEVMNLPLDQTELVVLSACETGLGKIRPGEGVYGLPRAFQSAGASAVLTTLWQVDDRATQLLMISFYEKWLNGMSKPAALKAAQAEIKEKFKLPFYWGAFVLTGI